MDCIIYEYASYFLRDIISSKSWIIKGLDILQSMNIEDWLTKKNTKGKIKVKVKLRP